MKFVRVSQELSCPICGSTKWCTIWDEGKTVACPRVASEESAGSFGYLHRLEIPIDVSSQQVAIETTPNVDWQGLAAYYQEQYEQMLYGPSSLFYPLKESCSAFGVGWDRQAYTLPMWSDGQCAGIQRRFPNGAKSAVAGSKRGLFVPTTTLGIPRTLVVCEGASDAIYFHAYGGEGFVIGRQNCDMVNEVLALHAHLAPQSTIILADNDEPGIRGAINLRDAIERNTYCSRIFVPRDKDVRETITKRGKLVGRWL
jgi:hypothetical protein